MPGCTVPEPFVYSKINIYKINIRRMNIHKKRLTNPRSIIKLEECENIQKICNLPGTDEVLRNGKAWS